MTDALFTPYLYIVWKNDEKGVQGVHPRVILSYAKDLKASTTTTSPQSISAKP